MQLHKMLIALASGLCVTAAAQAADYPTKPITLIVPFAPGGTTDIVGRILAEHLGRQLGQQVVVENRGGAGGAIGATAIAKSEPDGYTLGVATVSTHAVNPACQPSLSYDPIKDFVPVSNIASSPNMLAVNADFAPDYKQFIAKVKSNPGKYSFASSGVCGLAHMMGEQFKLATSTDILHVPYRGMGPALNDVLGGQIQMVFDNVPSSLPHVKTGKMNAIAVAWKARLESLPNVPTFAELGLKEVNDPAWYGLIAPAGTSPEIIKALNAAVVKALATPEAKERLRAVGTEPVGNSPAEYASQMAAELKKVKAVVAKQGIKPN